MGFISNLTSSIIKTALTPIALAKDAVNIVTGEDADATKTLLESAGDDVKQSAEDLADGEIL